MIKKNKVFFFFSWSSSCFLTFLFSFINSHLRTSRHRFPVVCLANLYRSIGALGALSWLEDESIFSNDPQSLDFICSLFRNWFQALQFLVRGWIWLDNGEKIRGDIMSVVLGGAYQKFVEPPPPPYLFLVLIVIIFFFSYLPFFLSIFLCLQFFLYILISIHIFRMNASKDLH